MNGTLTFLCPIDFSEASRGALRYATVLAERFGARLVVATIDDPLAHEAASLANDNGAPERDARQDLDRFFKQAVDRPHTVPELEFVALAGKPAPQILGLAEQLGCSLVVMGSHGVMGGSKLFFGATTERVLRETSVPVLVTPASDVGPDRFEDLKRIVRRVLAPVDLGTATPAHVQFARSAAELLGVPFLLTHVVERARTSACHRPRLPNVDLERRLRAELALGHFAGSVPVGVRPEALVVYGEPAEEIVKIAQDRGVGVIVMGLHSSPLTAPRMGSVTYRVLCQTRKLVLALPPGLKATIPDRVGRVEAPIPVRGANALAPPA